MLFREIFRLRFDEMPKVWRQFHTVSGNHCYHGKAEVVRGRGLLTGVLAWLLKLPPTSHVPIELTIEKSNQGEVWCRQFGAYNFSTLLSPAKGETPLCLYETYFPFRFCVALQVDEASVQWTLYDWWFLGVKLPKALVPISKTIEYVDNEGRYAFDIDLHIRFLGPLIAYKGWLDVERNMP